MLDRDDRGGLYDTVMVNGKRMHSRIREEIVTIRGIIAGEYTVNVAHYVATTGKPVQANVKIEKIYPTVQIIIDKQVVVDHAGDEKTAVRFSLDDAGKVIGIDDRPKSLIELVGGSKYNGPALDPKTGTLKEKL